MQFNKPYNRSEYIQFLKGFLTQSAVFNQKKLDIDKEKYSYLSSVTELAVDDSLGLVVYEIAHTSRRDARIGITSNAFKLLDSEFMQNALVIFYNENNVDNYRLSLITMNYKIVGNKLVREQSNPKRFSYLLGKGIGVHTPETFLSKGRISDNKDLLQRFSVEVLTKEFYEELSDWYAWALISDDVRFPSASSFVPDDVRKKEKAQNLIRLLTRLLFVWFLKQKNLIPDEIFDEDYIRENLLKNFYPEKIDEYDLFAKDSGTSYYKAILQNLFFATLNCPIIKEGTNELQRGFRVIGQHEDVNYLMRYKDLFKNPNLFLQLMNEKVPFLNGGLFDCLDRKYENPPVYIDGFSDTTDNCPVIPDYMFFSDGEIMNLKDYYEISRKSSTNVIGLIDLLKKYNFTVEENTPVDIQVSLDPELLGKVFENLLASYNPETGSTARKATGSYYTPRTVVQFMVTESLVQYISSKVPGVNKEDLYELISYTPSKVVDFSYSIKLKIIKALFECKILDPACGSGAFPMGVLQQMVHVLSILDPNNVEWKSIVIASVNQETLSINAIDGYDEKESRMKDLLETFEESLKMPDYARKLYLIENCIYGVDIQPIATQISHLRFFISLVVEQEPNNNNLKNFGIRPLPNLEAKFVAGNTLLKIKKIDDSLPLFRDSNIADKQSKLKDASHKLFRAKTSKTKRKYRDLIKGLRSEISYLLNKDGAIGNVDASLLAKWDMFNQNEAACFFDPEWMFDVSDGFDIIIGNPPYIQLQKNKGELAKLYESEDFSSYSKNGDIYCLFYEQGIKLLKEGGILTFITSNKWMRAGYGEALREFLSKNSNPLILLDCAGNKIFESATVDVNILITEKAQNLGKTISAQLTREGINNMSDFILHNSSFSTFSDGTSWIILSYLEKNIRNKIDTIGTPLKKWNISIYRGILTGYNEAFIITSEKRDQILLSCSNDKERNQTAKLIRPILRGRDINKYSYDWKNWYLISTFPSCNYDIEEYPAIKNYLLSCGKEKLEQCGSSTFIGGKEIKSRKKTNNKWFETQDSISYWEDFNKPKIIYPNMTKYLPFVYDTKNYLTNQKCFIITGEKVAYLTAFFNSSLFKYCYRDSFPELLGGTRELSKIFFEKIPVKEVSQSINKEFEQLVKDIQADYSKEKAIYIDKLIFDIYELSQEERQIIGYIEIT